ncbi:MAG: DUF2059 domain-containing protein [Bacteroidales bacterium]|nr:DUF2059 domain-containing protein [Bacteroidales bacterium]
MKRITILILAVSLSISSLFSQTENEYEQTLKKMLSISGTEASFETAISQMFQMYKQQQTDVPADIWDEFEQEFLRTSLDDLVEMFTPVYKKYLTIEDLKQIIKFYQTPAGKKYAEKTPLIMQESMEVGQQWGMKVGEKFQKKLEERGF